MLCSHPNLGGIMITREDVERLVSGSTLVGFVSASGVKTERRFQIRRAADYGGSVDLVLKDMRSGDEISCMAIPSGPNLVFYQKGRRMGEFWHEDAHLESQPQGSGQQAV